MAIASSLTDFGFGETNQSNVNLNQYQDMIRSKSCATTTNLEENENNVGGLDTNQDESGKLLFPGQHIARRSSVLNREVLKDLQDEAPIFMRKKTRWNDDETSDDEEGERSEEEASEEE